MQNQHHFQVEQWSDAHTDGLMRVSDQVHLIRMQDVERSRLQPYTPPVEADRPDEIIVAAEKVSTVVTILAKPAAITVGIVAAAKYLFGMATVATVSAGVGIEAWAMSNGGFLMFGGCAVAVSALIWVFSLFSGTQGSNGSSKAGGNNYYQYNNFGEQPNQNNGTK